MVIDFGFVTFVKSLDLWIENAAEFLFGFLKSVFVNRLMTPTAGLGSSNGPINNSSVTLLQQQAWVVKHRRLLCLSCYLFLIVHLFYFGLLLQLNTSFWFTKYFAKLAFINDGAICESDWHRGFRCMTTVFCKRDPLVLY